MSLATESMEIDRLFVAETMSDVLPKAAENIESIGLINADQLEAHELFFTAFGRQKLAEWPSSQVVSIDHVMYRTTKQHDENAGNTIISFKKVGHPSPKRILATLVQTETYHDVIIHPSGRFFGEVHDTTDRFKQDHELLQSREHPTHPFDSSDLSLLHSIALQVRNRRNLGNQH
jgi:hypothetical protein